MAEKKGNRNKLPSSDLVESGINDVSKSEDIKANKERNTNTDPAPKTLKKRSIYFENVTRDEGGEEHMLKTDDSKFVHKYKVKDTTKFPK